MFHFISARIWKIAALSALGGAIPLPGFSFAADIALLTKELRFYNSQLGIPDENSPEFENIYYISSEVTRIFTSWVVSNTFEEYDRFIPVFGVSVASSLSFNCTYYGLSQYLDTLRDAALEFIKQQKKKVEDDFDLEDIREKDDVRGTYIITKRL